MREIVKRLRVGPDRIRIRAPFSQVCQVTSLACATAIRCILVLGFLVSCGYLGEEAESSPEGNLSREATAQGYYITTTTTRPNTDVELPSQTSGGDRLPNRSDQIEMSADTGGCLKFVGDIVHFTLTAEEAGGQARVDIGDGHTGIRLYGGTHGDRMSSDGIYEPDYELTALDKTRSAPIVGRDIARDGREVQVYDPGLITVADWDNGDSWVDDASDAEVVTSEQGAYLGNRLVITFQDSGDFKSVKSILVKHNLTLVSWLPELIVFEVELPDRQDFEVVAQTDLYVRLFGELH